MAQKTITLEIAGEATLLDAGIDVFAYQSGYQDKVWEEGKNIPNPQTKDEFADTNGYADSDQSLTKGEFAIANGYKDVVWQDSREIDNPVSKVDFSRDVLRQFMRNTINAYNVAQAQRQAEEAARIQSESALDQLTMEIVS